MGIVGMGMRSEGSGEGREVAGRRVDWVWWTWTGDL